ncbi:hypothetical protein [Streptomyces zaomyceticus]|uniref:hypothetical protein n=1 Tax=Streptomyces zaomyceticus TaxID=68286 RepID=UPI002E236F0B
MATFQDNLTGGETTWSERAYGVLGLDRDGPPLPWRPCGDGCTGTTARPSPIC